MQYTGVFPTIQLEIPTFHSIYAQVQLGILALKSTNQPELGSKRPPAYCLLYTAVGTLVGNPAAKTRVSDFAR